MWHDGFLLYGGEVYSFYFSNYFFPPTARNTIHVAKINFSGLSTVNGNSTHGVATRLLVFRIFNVLSTYFQNNKQNRYALRA